MSNTKNIVENRLNNTLIYTKEERIEFVKQFLIQQYADGYVDEVREVYIMLPPQVQDRIRGTIELLIYTYE